MPHQFPHSLALSQPGTVCSGTARDTENERTRGIMGEGGEERCSSLTRFAPFCHPDRVAIETRADGKVELRIASLCFLHCAINGSSRESNFYVTYVTLTTPDLNPVRERRDKLIQCSIISYLGLYRPAQQAMQYHTKRLFIQHKKH